MSSILVVEDDEAIRNAVRRGLSERGHAVATAATGMSGLEQLLARPPTWRWSTSACRTSTGSRSSR